MKDKQEEIKSSQSHFDSWLHAKSISLIIMSIAFAVRLYNSTISIDMDTATLLSILLALFSVALSAMFYFKATDTSNKFYDNSYRYTKDVAELLVKIESGFGERLKHLDEGYNSMRDQIQKYSSIDHSIQQTKINLKAEQEDIDKIKSEKNELMKKLFESSRLRQEEKDELAKELESRENELKESQREISRLNKRLFVERMEKRDVTDDLSVIKDRVRGFSLAEVMPKLPTFENISFSSLSHEFEDIKLSLPSEYLNDLKHLGYVLSNDRVSRKGYAFFRNLARDFERL